ncbi:MAG: FAD-binding oxidoreductase [Candidatus Pacebacteria bacterium]|nr:FAD-binding oxidoreductase [Candidatus Paceibacterota bacterium]MBP9851517.1 FAD-binding oxidoreductase [Candidatus Paceibacterota bacterium]
MKEEIKKFFKGDLDDSEETLVKYSHDASVFEVKPQVVLFPKDSEDVKNLVKWVGDNKEKYPAISITCRCAGTDMSGGSIGESIILDFTKYMNKLIGGPNPIKNSTGSTLPGVSGGNQNFLPFAGTITVEPGMFYRDFEKITKEKGMILPCYTASKNLNAMGGMFGNNSAGERTLRFGKTEEYIAEAQVVFADGNEYTVKPLSKNELEAKISQNDFEGGVYKRIFNLITENAEDLKNAKPKVHKNSAGYTLWNVVDFDGVRGEAEYFDLNRILVGSQGTLGIVTQITFKLIEDPKYRKLLVLFMRDMNLLPGLVNKILVHNPETIETYDDKTFFLVLKYIKDFTKLLGVGNLLKLMFSFGPEALMTLRHGFPKLIILVEFAGSNQAEVDLEAKKTLESLRMYKKIGLHLTRSEFEAKKYWTIRHEAFNLIRYHLKKVKSKPFIDDVVVRPEHLPEFMPELYKILGEYKDEMTFAVGGHAGDGNLHIYTLVDPSDPNLKQMVLDVSDKVYTLVTRLGGSITAEHNDGLIRTPYLNKMYNPKIINIFKDIKGIFDLKHILNPGKKVPEDNYGPGTREYLIAHIPSNK